MSFPFDETVFWPAFKAAGMLTRATVIYRGTERPFDIDVAFARPEIDPVTMVRTSDYPMEFQHDDAPELVEGDQVQIGQTLYRVRELPRVEGQTATGFFRVAKLTEVRT